MQNASAPTIKQNDRFKILADRLAAILITEQIQVRTYAAELPHFSRLSDHQQKTANDHLEFYCDLCEEQMAEGKSLKDSPSFVWRALKRLDLTPRSDLFNYFDNNSLIEIYSHDNVQLFRNLNFFNYCSYSLEELHSKEWYWLFDRDPSITAKIYKYVVGIFNGELNQNVTPEIAPHIVRELNSEGKLHTECTFRVFGPLLRDGKTVALVAGASAKFLNK